MDNFKFPATLHCKYAPKIIINMETDRSTHTHTHTQRKVDKLINNNNNNDT